MTRFDDNDERRVRVRNTALLLGLFAAGLYLAYIVFWAVRGGA